MLFLGVFGFAVALMLSVALGRTRNRVLALIAGGVVVWGGLFVLFYFLAPTNAQEAGSDSGEFFGRYVDPLALWFPAANLLGWLLGLAAGWPLHNRRRDIANPS